MKKGFTLIELLIVIGILAVLAGIVVVALNPAELLKQARDSKRMADLGGLTSAINLYLTDVASPTFTCAAGMFYATVSTTGSGVSPFATTLASTTSASTKGLTNGNGWIPVALSGVSGGSPISALPTDPTDSITYYYAYNCTTSPSNLFEVDARLESTKYKAQMTTDGGDKNTCSTYVESTCWYETGNSLTQ
ncbi:MAG: type II secretion system protein [Candidatus Paceibacterota bacterium]